MKSGMKIKSKLTIFPFRGTTDKRDRGGRFEGEEKIGGEEGGGAS